MNPDSKWQVIFVSDLERYGICVQVNGVLQLVCRNMVAAMANRLCKILNDGRIANIRDLVYNTTAGEKGE